MRVKKLKINGYDVFFHKTNKYTTIDMTLLFELPYTRDSIFMCDLLEEYMMHSMKKYKTRKSIATRKKELYSIGGSMYNYNKGKKMFVEVNGSIIDPKLVKDDYFYEALEFVRDLIFEPNFENGKLDQEELKRCKDNLCNRVSDSLLNKSARAKKSLRKNMYPNTYLMIDNIDTLEEYKSLLDSYKDEDLIKIHDEVFNKSLVGIVISGNIGDRELGYIEELFKFKSIRELDTNYEDKLKINRKTSFYTKVEDKDFNESKLTVVYEAPARSRKDKLVYHVIAKMLNESGMIIHKTLREEMKLVYSAGCAYNKTLNYLKFNANIDKEKESVAIDGIDLVLEKLKDPKLIEEQLVKIKEDNEMDLYIYDENKWNPYNEMVCTSFKFDIPFKKKCNIMKAITTEDILTALDKLKKVKIHFYLGAKEK